MATRRTYPAEVKEAFCKAYDEMGQDRCIKIVADNLGIPEATCRGWLYARDGDNDRPAFKKAFLADCLDIEHADHLYAVGARHHISNSKASKWWNEYNTKEGAKDNDTQLKKPETKVRRESKAPLAQPTQSANPSAQGSRTQTHPGPLQSYGTQQHAYPYHAPAATTFPPQQGPPVYTGGGPAPFQQWLTVCNYGGTPLAGHQQLPSQYPPPFQQEPSMPYNGGNEWTGPEELPPQSPSGLPSKSDHEDVSKSDHKDVSKSNDKDVSKSNHEDVFKSNHEDVYKYNPEDFYRTSYLLEDD